MKHSLDDFEKEMRRKYPDWNEMMAAARRRFSDSGGLKECRIEDITDMIMMDRGNVRLRTDCQ